MHFRRHPGLAQRGFELGNETVGRRELIACHQAVAERNDELVGGEGRAREKEQAERQQRVMEHFHGADIGCKFGIVTPAP